MEKPAGKFIVIEGLDGSGKTVKSKLLADHLKKLGLKVSLSFEPTSGPIGAIIRHVLVGRLQVDPRTLAALYAADRLDHITNSTNGIAKHLREGVIEICDRYYLTSYAYQTLSVDEDWVWQLNSQAIRPDLTIFLDVDPEECWRRLSRSQIDEEMFHDLAHLREARTKYLAAISKLKDRERIVVVDSNGDLQEVSERVIGEATTFLRQEKII
jgi:dTMP kinase